MANIRQDKAVEQKAPTTAIADCRNQAFQDTDKSHRFKPPQSNFRLSRRIRPPPIQITPEAEEKDRVPLGLAKLERRGSKGGLRGIFTRSRAHVENSIVSPVMEEPPPASAVSERPRGPVPRSLSIKRATTSASQAAPATPSRPTGQPTSRMDNLRSKSNKQARIPNKPGPKSIKSPPRAPSRTSPAWDPPPLFQAYPQSIKHATLIASTLSADAILRMNHHRKSDSLRDEIAQIRPGSNAYAQNSAAKKTEKAKSKHRRQLSGSISKADWTHKIFVLVTSGYLLQYAGEGSFDRLPEKMMQLGKESVAFASDAIPGKHWVLQVSQSMDSDGSPAADPRSLLSRLTFRGADYRRTATSFLLVLNSAEQMDAWLAVLRREIEALGGKKQISETGKPKADEKIIQFKAQPSHRYLVQRDPDQFTNPSSPRSPSAFLPWNENQLQQGLELAASALATSQVPSAQPLAENNSATNSVASHDGRQLDSLRDSTNRLSYISADQRTLITSQGSSITNSPTRESCSTLDDFPQKVSLDETRLRPNASAINERRRSMQTATIPVLEAHSPRNFRHSIHGGPVRPIQGRSPTVTNFGITSNSISKYSAKGPPLSKALGVNTRKIPSAVTNTPSKIGQPISRGKGKGITALRLDRQSVPPVRVPIAVLTPVEPSAESICGTGTSSDNNGTRSSGPTPALANRVIPKRRSSLVPFDSSGSFVNGFQLPPQYSNASGHDRTSEKLPEISVRPALPPTPPAISPLSPPPAVPNTNVKDHVTKPRIEKEPPKPFPVIAATTAPKLRRPISMQIRNSSPAVIARRPTTRSVRSPSSLSTPDHDIATSNSTPNATTKSPPRITATKPELQRLRSENDPKNLASRRSMPLLVTGPPPAPPPDCALPPLPPADRGSKLLSKNSGQA